MCRRGTRQWSGHDRTPPRGRDVRTVPLGAGACRPSSAPRHGDPGPRPASAGHRSGILGPRHLVPLRRNLPSPPVRSSSARGLASALPRTIDGTPRRGPTDRFRPVLRTATKTSVGLGAIRLRSVTVMALDSLRLGAPCPRMAPPMRPRSHWTAIPAWKNRQKMKVRGLHDWGALPRQRRIEESEK
jgi:hypothetical protein